MPSSYANIDIEQLLIRESNRIGPDIYRKTVDQSPWLKLVKQDAWPDEMGDTVRVLVYERSLPYNSDGTLKQAWTNIASNSTYPTNGNQGVGNAVAPDGGTIQIGQTLREYNLQHTSLNSPDLSLNDLRFPLKRKEQLSNIMSILTESTAEIWIQRYRDEYTRLADNKLLATTANATGGGTVDYSLGVARRVDGSFPQPSATSTDNLELTQGVLDRVYLSLIRDGAGSNAYDRVNGAPVFLAIMSPEASDSIIRANADIRQDFRWSDRVSELLAPLGITRTYRNFHHLIDPFPPRWDIVSGAWVRRNPFVPASNDLGVARQGFKYELNSNYLSAAYEDTIVFVPEVFTSLVPKPISATGEMQFDPQNYRGEFTWRNIPDRVSNPDGTVGFFRAIFASGSKPVHPQQGYVIRHRRSAVSIV